MPELFLKIFLPNKPSNKNPASGNSGISAMVVALGIVFKYPRLPDGQGILNKE